MKLIVIETATGNVVGQWEGGESPPSLPNGREYVPADGIAGSVAGKRWDAELSAFVDRPHDPQSLVHRIDSSEFMDRFTEAEEEALEELSEDKNKQGRLMRLLVRRLTTRDTVRLDDPRLVSLMTQLQQIFRQRGVWDTDTIADQRFSQIMS